MRAGLLLDNCAVGGSVRSDSYEKLGAMGAGAGGLLWTGGTHHGRDVYERCEWATAGSPYGRPLYIVRVGGHRQTADEWVTDARAALAEVPGGVLLEGRMVLTAGNEPNLEGWAGDPAGYGAFYRGILDAGRLRVPVLFACPSLGVAGWEDYLRLSSELVGRVPDGVVCNLYGANVAWAANFKGMLKSGCPLYVGEVNSLPEVRGDDRRAFLREAFAVLARAGVVAGLVFIAGGASGGAWDDRYIVTAAEVAGLGPGARSIAASADGATDKRIGGSELSEGDKVDDEIRQRVEGWSFVFGPVAVASGVRASLVAGLIAVESGGRPEAVSPVNRVDGRAIGRAHGLMQVLPGHFHGVVIGDDGEVSLGDGRWMRQPLVNVASGVAVLRGGMERFGGSEVSGIAAYFGAVDGEGNPTASEDVTGTPGTRYVELVEGASEYFRWLDGVPWERFAAVNADVDRGACEYGETWREVAINLLGVCNDALATGRSVAAAARGAGELWGSR